MKLLKIIQERVFCNENLSNLGNVLQRNLRIGRARESIFRVTGGTNFENFLHSELTMVAPS